MTDFERLIRTLTEGRVEFIIIGGLAATAHGSARLTQDVDIVYARSGRGDGGGTDREREVVAWAFDLKRIDRDRQELETRPHRGGKARGEIVAVDRGREQSPLAQKQREWRRCGARVGRGGERLGEAAAGTVDPWAGVVVHPDEPRDIAGRDGHIGDGEAEEEAPASGRLSGSTTAGDSTPRARVHRWSAARRGGPPAALLTTPDRRR